MKKIELTSDLLHRDIQDAVKKHKLEILEQERKATLRRLLEKMHSEIFRSYSTDKRVWNDESQRATLDVKQPIPDQPDMFLKVRCTVTPYTDQTPPDSGSFFYHVDHHAPGEEPKILMESRTLSFDRTSIYDGKDYVDLTSDRAGEFIHLFENLLTVVSAHEQGIRDRVADNYERV